MSPLTNEPHAPQSMCLIQQTGISQEQISVISRFAMASIGSQGTVGGLVVAGFVSLIPLYNFFIVFSVQFGT